MARPSRTVRLRADMMCRETNTRIRTIPFSEELERRANPRVHRKGKSIVKCACVKTKVDKNQVVINSGETCVRQFKYISKHDGGARHEWMICLSL